MLKRLFKEFKYGEKGFTLIELLVVIAILGVLAAVAVPNISKFIGSGKTEANATELSTVQTAVVAMMADAKAANIDQADGTQTGDMNAITCTSGATTYHLNNYVVANSLTGTTLKSGNTYHFNHDGSVLP
jgi:prepilin-type N-terminal cleavage/methylation domain-containing protein